MQYLIKDNVLIGSVTTQRNFCHKYCGNDKRFSPDSHSFVSELIAREKVTDSLHGNAQDKNQGAPCQTKQGHEGERK